MSSALQQSLGGLLLEHKARSLERNFRAFAEAAWPVLEPATPFIAGRHIDIIAEYLTAVSVGQIKRLIINIPPRMTKSTLVSILWPAWSWAEDDATSRWMFCSYSASLSVKHSLDRRTLLTSDWFRALWPKVQLAADQNEKAQFSSTNRGHMLALSTGGTTTGKGGQVLVVDDPHSVEQALSDAERASGIRFLRQTLMTRLDDPRTGRIVLIMQRLHELDATGELLRDGGWEHLCLPAIAEKRQVIFLPITGREIVREEGDLLEPERLSAPTLENLKRSMGSFSFAGQMQQTPAPAEGGLFKRSWWQRYSVAPTSITSIVQSWDCTFKDSLDADYVVGQVWGFDGVQAFLLDQVKRRMSYTATRQAMRDMYAKWPRTAGVLVEDKANGSAIIDELKREIHGLIAVEPEGGKLSRAWACTAQVEAGQVYVPDSAPWAEDFLLECSTFPNASHDDQVDAMTQALNWQRVHNNNSLYSRMLNDDRLLFNLEDMGPGFGNCTGERFIAVGWSIDGFGALEIHDDSKTLWLMRECYVRHALTQAEAAEALARFGAGWDPLLPPDAPAVLARSRPLDARTILSDVPETETLRLELAAKGFWCTPVDDDLLRGAELVGSVLSRGLLKIARSCPVFLNQHGTFAFDSRAATQGKVEPLSSTNTELVSAFRQFCLAVINPWRLML